MSSLNSDHLAPAFIYKEQEELRLTEKEERFLHIHEDQEGFIDQRLEDCPLTKLQCPSSETK